MRPLHVLPLLAGALLAHSASADIVYSNTFESGVAGPEWTAAHIADAPTFTKFLGRYSNNTPTCSDHATLTLPNGGDAGHSLGQCTLGFDLYIIDSWEGDWGAPDRMQVVINGNTVFNYTFSNTNPPQSYPFRPTIGPAQIGYGTSIYDNDSIYRQVQIPFDVGNASNIVITWQSVGLENQADESWGIDNVNVSSVPAPGPAALLGLGGFIAARRRRCA